VTVQFRPVKTETEIQVSRLIAEYSSGGAVAAEDAARQAFPNDWIIRGVDHSCEVQPGIKDGFISLIEQRAVRSVLQGP
jgi:hypothetical protein